ncbi:hypothetical protein C0585_05510 [Candidatus Woesearchaeota archaeon]|nr:MAG: hypothetical protein C0585_05510 [Candidatus Woesearchaeota archaeon]
MLLITVIIYNLIISFFIVVFGTKMLIHSVENFIQETAFNKYDDYEKMSSSTEMIREEIRMVERKFWISFYIVEPALIAYFVFWCIMFYFNIRII